MTISCCATKMLTISSGLITVITGIVYPVVFERFANCRNTHQTLLLDDRLYRPGKRASKIPTRALSPHSHKALRDRAEILKLVV